MCTKNGLTDLRLTTTADVEGIEAWQYRKLIVSFLTGAGGYSMLGYIGSHFSISFFWIVAISSKVVEEEIAYKPE
jgi:hypothetical protein